jgi:anti-anti-sigma factor
MPDSEHPGRREDAITPLPAFRMERAAAQDGVMLLVLAGEIDLATSGQFRAVVDEALAAGAALVADFEEVAFMDSTMLRELLRAHRELEAAGTRFIIAAAQPPVLRLLELTGTTGLFVTEPTREAALAAAGGPTA